MRRRTWLGLSLSVTIMATSAIMIAGGYYESPDLLAMQIPALAVPIGTPLIVAGFHRRHTLTLWLLAAAILTVGWGYVVYVDTRPYQGGGASLAAVIGWFASGIALCVTLLWIAIARLWSALVEIRQRRLTAGRG